MPQVTVRYFAVLRERRGTEVEQIEIADEESIQSLYHRLFPPGPHGSLPVGYARNQEYVDPSTTLHDGDEVAFLPPLGGG